MPAPNYNLAESQKLNLPLLLKPKDCKGRTFVVTGANSGIGYDCAKHLVQLSASRVIITVRDQERGNETKARLEAETGREGVVDVRLLNLTSFDSVRTFVKKLEAEVDRVDGVVANAGTSNGVWVENEGIEGNLAVNLFANLLLLALMVPYLKASGQKFGFTPHFTLVGSIGPFVAPKSPLDGVDRNNILADLNDRKKRDGPDMSPSYTFSKLFLLFAVRQLALRSPAADTGVIINVTEPGMCKTSLTKNLSWVTRLITWISLKFLGRTPEMGSRAVLAGLALGPACHGSFVSDCEVHDDRYPDWAANEDGQAWQKRVWEEVAGKLEQIEPGCLGWIKPN
uniref:Short chain dehydrogenase n=1 Tax=Emericellopsis sp. TaxID=88752 RepID=A0AA96NNI0_9HYPO|nr:putative short chain dehydrogenase [Emericellopsis sp.]